MLVRPSVIVAEAIRGAGPLHAWMSRAAIPLSVITDSTLGHSKCDSPGLLDISLLGTY
jgi:hypothetical protein